MFDWLFDRNLLSNLGAAAFRRRGLQKVLLGLLATLGAPGGFALLFLVIPNASEIQQFVGSLILVPLLLPMLIWGIVAILFGALQVCAGQRLGDISRGTQILGIVLIPVLLGGCVIGAYQFYQWHTYQPPRTPFQQWADELTSEHVSSRLSAIGQSKFMKDRAIPLLRKTLREDPIPEVKGAAAKALGDMGPGAGESEPDLEKALLSESNIVRNNAAVALSKISVNAGKAAPVLLEALKEVLKTEKKTYYYRKEYIQAIGRVGPSAEKAIPVLQQLIVENPNSSVGFDSGDALGKIGPAAVPSLQELLRHKQPGTRAIALKALGVIGADAARAVPDMLKSLDHERDRVVAIEALGNIGPKAEMALPTILTLKDDKDPFVRMAVQLACWQIAENRESITKLTEYLTNKDRRARRYAVIALGTVGPEAGEALSKIRFLAKDPDEYIRKAAIAALKKIEP